MCDCVSVCLRAWVQGVVGGRGSKERDKSEECPHTAVAGR